MRIKLYFKDPDCVSIAIDKAIDDLDFSEVEDEDSFIQSKREEIKKQLEPWIKYDEYVTIIIDTDAGTAKVERVS